MVPGEKKVPETVALFYDSAHLVSDRSSQWTRFIM